MGSLEIIMLIVAIPCIFFICQQGADGYIGNRSYDYSVWYETHFLVKKKGICKLIYFKPKHFGRYTLYEVMSFFASFLFPILLVCLAICVSINLFSNSIFILISALMLGFVMISNIGVMVINDIGANKDEKKKFDLESGERENVVSSNNVDFEIKGKDKKWAKGMMKIFKETKNNPYFTVHNLWDSYYASIKQANNNAEKIEEINIEYIKYFRKMEKLVVVKENKDGTLIFKKDIQ